MPNSRRKWPPAEIALRSQDGKLYFTEWEGYIGQISTTGVVRYARMGP